MKYTFALVVLLLFVTFGFEPVIYGQVTLINLPMVITDQQLDKLIADLDRPEARVQALTILLEFCRYKFSQIPSLSFPLADRKIDAMMHRAVSAINAHRTLELVADSMKSYNTQIQAWGLMNWHPWNCKGVDDCKNVLALMPLVKELAMSKDTYIRALALNLLKSSGKAADFVASRDAAETSATVLLQLTIGGSLAEWSSRFNPRLLVLLSHQDQSIRHDALLTIGANGYTAEMYKIQFDMPIFDRVIELTKSRLASDRSDAAFALTEIQKMDSQRSLAAFLRLSKDQSSEVRWRAGFALGKQTDVKARPVVARLIHDRTPLVSYMTIISAGPEYYKKELEKLSRCNDHEVVDMATGALKRLAQDGR